MNESEFAARLLETEQQREHKPLEIELESHYNHFGDRGAVDVYVERRTIVQLYELKSEQALENSSGANEIIRQFNRMQDYYFKDESNNNTTKDIEYILAFYPTGKTIQRLKDNLALYNNITGREKEKLAMETRVHVSKVILHDGKQNIPANLDQLNAVEENHLDADHPVLSLKDSLLG